MSDSSLTHKTSVSSWQGYFFALTTIAIWASFVIVSRLAGKSSLNPFDVTALRLGMAALALSPWWLPRLFRPNLRRVPWQRAVVFAILVGLGYPLLAYSGFYFAPAKHGAVLLSGVLPFFTAFFAYFVLSEKPTKPRFFGLMLIFIGVLCLFFANTPADSPKTAWQGDLLFLAGSAFWGLFGVLLKRWQVRAFDVMLAVVAFSAFMYLPVYILFLPKNLFQSSYEIILTQACFQGLIVVCVAMLTYAKAAEHLGPSRLAVLMSIVPAVATILAVLVLGETVTFLGWFGVSLTSFGAMFGALWGRK